MLVAGRTEGAHRACVLLGIVATCRTIGVPAQAYLTWAFERLGTHRDVFALPVEHLTPAAFKRTLRRSRARQGRRPGTVVDRRHTGVVDRSLRGDLPRVAGFEQRCAPQAHFVEAADDLRFVAATLDCVLAYVRQVASER